MGWWPMPDGWWLAFLLLILFEVGYFIRSALHTVLALKIRKQIHVMNESWTFGICTTRDIDILHNHMNNARYLREMDFGRFEFFGRSRLFKTLMDRGAQVMVAATTIRYRKPIFVFSPYRLVSKLLYWEDRSLYMEQRFETLHDNFVRATAIVKVGLVGMTAEDLVNLTAGENVICPPPPSYLVSWISYNKQNSQSLKGTASPRRYLHEGLSDPFKDQTSSSDASPMSDVYGQHLPVKPLQDEKGVCQDQQSQVKVADSNIIQDSGFTQVVKKRSASAGNYDSSGRETTDHFHKDESVIQKSISVKVSPAPEEETLHSIKDVRNLKIKKDTLSSETNTNAKENNIDSPQDATLAANSSAIHSTSTESVPKSARADIRVSETNQDVSDGTRTTSNDLDHNSRSSSTASSRPDIGDAIPSNIEAKIDAPRVVLPHITSGHEQVSPAMFL
ncbi:uncharacterized protein LOC143019598 [Oratosquilla oratoria]|uniref:uncharacterized protein LOC143019598 n=1 Tax=Oratosquilla oratoria TaxID=337810 RepID=UPI003F75E16A